MSRTHAPTDLSDSEYESLAEFRHALRRFLRASEEAARSVGITPNQHQLLLAVRGWRGEHKPSIRDLAEQLQLRHHSTVELAQRAADAGLVAFRPDATDARKQLVELTPIGRRKLAELYEHNHDDLRGFRQRMRDLLVELE